MLCSLCVCVKEKHKHQHKHEHGHKHKHERSTRAEAGAKGKRIICFRLPFFVCFTFVIFACLLYHFFLTLSLSFFFCIQSLSAVSLSTSCSDCPAGTCHMNDEYSHTPAHSQDIHIDKVLTVRAVGSRFCMKLIWNSLQKKSRVESGEWGVIAFRQLS